MSNYALMHYVEPDQWFNDEKGSQGFWAWSFADDLGEVPRDGDTFSYEKGEAISFRDCLSDMQLNAKDWAEGCELWLRQKNGKLVRAEKEYITPLPGYNPNPPHIQAIWALVLNQ